MTRYEERHGRASSALSFAPDVYRKVEEPSGPSPIDSLRIELRAEVRALRALVTRDDRARGLAVELAQIRAALDQFEPATVQKRDRITRWLKARGVEGAALVRIAKQARSGSMEEALLRVVGFEPWTPAEGRRRIVTVIGPSGVGKTTTIAKIAAKERMRGRSIALVSCDGFRVGAVDQLARYAELLEAPFYVARTQDELASAVARAGEDVVFVDTSGRPPAVDSPESAVLAIAEKRALEPKIILCMTASTRASDATRIAATYAPASPAMVCVTKTDETNAPSGLVHAPVAAKLPLALVCYGPRVPEDVEPATAASVMARLAAEVKA